MCHYLCLVCLRPPSEVNASICVCGQSHGVLGWVPVLMRANARVDRGRLGDGHHQGHVVGTDGQATAASGEEMKLGITRQI